MDSSMTSTEPSSPPGWDNDERMSYLFSAFRERRDINPHDWDNKLSFWKSAIMERCGGEKQAVIDCKKVPEMFMRKGRVPMCVNRVLVEMAKSGELVRQSDFESSVNASWLSWGINYTVYKPLGWAYGAVFRRNQQSLDGTFIIMDVLKKVADSIVTHHHDSMNPSSILDHIVDYSTLRDSCKSICTDENTFRLTLLYLQKSKRLTVSDAPVEKQVIKFLGKNQSRISHINETEIGILRLKKTIASIEEQIQQLVCDMNRLQEETRQNLRKGLKSSAKVTLRKKKLAEKSIENKEATIDTLNHMLDRIKNAETDQMIMEAYKSGATALKKTLADTGLTSESVDETMSEVQEVMEMCSEIDDTINRGNRDIDESVSFDSGIDAEALEEELADLLNSDDTNTVPEKDGDKSAASSSVLKDLPAVPQTEPLSGDDTFTSPGEDLLASPGGDPLASSEEAGTNPVLLSS